MRFAFLLALAALSLLLGWFTLCLLYWPTPGRSPGVIFDNRGARLEMTAEGD